MTRSPPSPSWPPPSAAGEAGKAALGMLLSDPDVTTAAVRSVLPGAILYDLLLAPLVLLAGRPRHARRRAGARPSARVRRDQRLASVSAGAGQRRPNCGLSARERTTERLRRADPRSCGLPAREKTTQARPRPRRVPKLRLSDARCQVRARASAAASWRSISLGGWQGHEAELRREPPAPRATPSRRRPRQELAAHDGRVACRIPGREERRWPARGWLSSAASPPDRPPRSERPARRPVAGSARRAADGRQRGQTAAGA